MRYLFLCFIIMVVTLNCSDDQSNDSEEKKNALAESNNAMITISTYV